MAFFETHTKTKKNPLLKNKKKNKKVKTDFLKNKLK